MDYENAFDDDDDDFFGSVPLDQETLDASRQYDCKSVFTVR